MMTADQEQLLQRSLLDATPQKPEHARPIIVIGAGSIVRDAHLPAYRKAGFRVAALVDLDLERAQTVAREFEVPLATSSVDEAMRGCAEQPVFDVAVPAGRMLDVVPLLPDGAAVLLQKPMGETLAEAHDLLELCRRKRLQAAVNFQLRWSPVMLAARSIAAAGLLGEVHDMSVEVSVYMPWDLWTFLKTAARLEILYHSIHYVDLVRAWFGNPGRVLARTIRNPRTPDLAATKSTILMDYGDWKRAFIATNHAHDFPDSQISRVRWEGTEGTVEATMGVLLDYPQGRPDTLRFARRGEPWRELPAAGNWFPDAFIGSMGSLQAYVAGESSELPTGVESAIDTMRVVEAAYLCSERGGTTLPD